MSIISIPLSKLVPSPVNVRKVGGTTLDELAASIAAHGLIQSLTVRAAGGGRYAVVAGGRRLAALKRLAKDKRLARSFPVPCRVLDDENATEISLAENVIRQAMHPADQFEAFRALSDQGLAPADIAARFGCREETVAQRLKLATVSPRLMEVYRQDGMTLEQLMAFTLGADHAAQEAAWFDAAYDWQRHPRSLRERLTETKVAATDRRVRLVGIDAYVAAGGTVTRDLFASDETGYLDDPALLERLVAERLAEAAEAVRAEGWSWVAVEASPAALPMRDVTRLDPPLRPFTEEEQAELDRLGAEYDDLAGQLESEADPDGEARLRLQLDAVEAALDALQALDRADWSAIDKDRAGAVVTFDRAGALCVVRGLVLPEAATDPADSLPSAAVTEAPKARPAWSAALLEDLSAGRSWALRVALARDPAVALDALLWTLVARAFGLGRPSASALRLHMEGGFVGKHREPEGPAAEAWQALRDGWAGRLPATPEGLWEWLRAAALSDKLALLAWLVAGGLNAVQVQGGPAPWQAEALHAALSLDMAEWWQPDAAFLTRLSKAQILSALAEAGASQHTLAACGLKKKAVLVEEAAAILQAARWLPAPLRLPQPEATAEAEAA